MKSNRRTLISVVVVMFAVFAVASSTAAAVSPPTWQVGTTEKNRHVLNPGKSLGTTLTGGAITAEFEYIDGLHLEVYCAKSSGTGTVIGGEPGKAKITLSFSNCEGYSRNCEKASLLKLENIEGELAVLKDGKTVVEKLIIPSSKPVPFLAIEGSTCFVGPGPHSIYGNLPGLVGGGEALEFPKTLVEGYSLELEEFPIRHFTDNITQKLVNGEKLFVNP